MFVGMWMTKDPLTVRPDAKVGEVAALMARHAIRRVPVVDPSRNNALVGIVSRTDVMHAFPPDINPLSAVAAEAFEAIERASGHAALSVERIMTQHPATTTSDAPIETAARMMRDLKIGALPVLSNQALVGVITESDIFRAFVAMFESEGRGARITFSITPNEDVLPLLTAIQKYRKMRIVNVVSLPRHEPPVCVVQVTGIDADSMSDEIWKSKHRVLHVAPLS